jgi:hypothetical protein
VSGVFLSAAEDFVAVFDDELDGIILGMHVGHFAFQACISHYSRCKDNSKVLRCHLKHINGSFFKVRYEGTY